MKTLIGGPAMVYVVVFGALTALAEIWFLDYRRDVTVLKWLTPCPAPTRSTRPSAVGSNPSAVAAQRASADSANDAVAAACSAGVAPEWPYAVLRAVTTTPRVAVAVGPAQQRRADLTPVECRWPTGRTRR